MTKDFRLHRNHKIITGSFVHKLMVSYVVLVVLVTFANSIKDKKVEPQELPRISVQKHQTCLLLTVATLVVYGAIRSQDHSSDLF